MLRPIFQFEEFEKKYQSNNEFFNWLATFDLAAVPWTLFGNLFSVTDLLTLCS